MSTALVRRRQDGLIQIVPARARAVDRYPDTVAVLVLALGLYVSTLLSARAMAAIAVACVAVEVWRAWRGRRLSQPLAPVAELAVERRRARGG